MVTALSEHVSADDSLTSGEVVSLAWQLRGVDSEDLHMTTVAREGFGTGPNGEDVVLLDEAKLSDLADALARDDVASCAVAVLRDETSREPQMVGDDRADRWIVLDDHHP